MGANTTVLTDALIALNGENLAQGANEMTLTLGTNTENNNCFGTRSENSTYTLKTASGSVGGFYAPEGSDVLFRDILQNDVDPQLLAAAVDQTEGQVAYILGVRITSHTFGGNHGELSKYSADFASANPEIRIGTLMNVGQLTATGPLTSQELTALSATQRLYGQMHITAVSGGTPSLDIKVESDVDAGFASPVDRLTFTTATEKGAEQLNTLGPITDTFYRFNVTAISGTFDVILVLAIN